MTNDKIQPDKTEEDTITCISSWSFSIPSPVGSFDTASTDGGSLEEEGVEWTLSSHHDNDQDDPNHATDKKKQNKAKGRRSSSSKTTNTSPEQPKQSALAKAKTFASKNKQRWLFLLIGISLVAVLSATIVVILATTRNASSSSSLSSSVQNDDNEQQGNDLVNTSADDSDIPADDHDKDPPAVQVTTTDTPTTGPTTVAPTTLVPTTLVPTTLLPTSMPTFEPTGQPTEFQQRIITMYAMGDLPYDERQAALLDQYVKEIPNDAAFVVHVGDMRSAATSAPCRWNEYTSVADSLAQSPAPVFMLIGDNDVHDCPDTQQGLAYWEATLDHLWQDWSDAPERVTPMAAVPGTWTFVQDDVLFIGVHLTQNVSPLVPQQAAWCIQLIQDYVQDMYPYTGRVVIFSHAGMTMTQHHAQFFDDLADYARNELRDAVPMLFVQGNTHVWNVEENFYGRPSWMKITVEGEAREAPTRLRISSTGSWQDPAEAFHYARRF